MSLTMSISKTLAKLFLSGKNSFIVPSFQGFPAFLGHMLYFSCVQRQWWLLYWSWCVIICLATHSRLSLNNPGHCPHLTVYIPQLMSKVFAVPGHTKRFLKSSLFNLSTTMTVSQPAMFSSLLSDFLLCGFNLPYFEYPELRSCMI